MKEQIYPSVCVHSALNATLTTAAVQCVCVLQVRFVKEQIIPVLEAKRTEVVGDHKEEWSQQLKVTVCLADGAPARISALNAACRSYRPDYLHVWRTKTFWDTQVRSPHTTVVPPPPRVCARNATDSVCTVCVCVLQTLSEEDVESHAFKKLEMRPATHRSQLL